MSTKSLFVNTPAGIVLRVPHDQNYSLRVVALNGRRVDKYTGRGGDHLVDTKRLRSGVYLLTARVGRTSVSRSFSVTR